jgi:hypothetical protein
MPFIRRDPTGTIVEALDAPTGEALEFLEADDPEVNRFHQRQGDAAQIREELAISDVEMARVVEDLIDVLIKKKVLSDADLPSAVNSKLNRRRAMRKTMNSLGRLISDD